MTNDLAIRILSGDILGTTEQTHEAVAMAVKALSVLPSSEPKIIRCEYCAHRNQYRFPPKYEVKDYCEVHEKVTALTNFCSWAERRKNG